MVPRLSLEVQVELSDSWAPGIIWTLLPTWPEMAFVFGSQSHRFVIWLHCLKLQCLVEWLQDGSRKNDVQTKLVVETCVTSGMPFTLC